MITPTQREDEQQTVIPSGLLPGITAPDNPAPWGDGEEDTDGH